MEIRNAVLLASGLSLSLSMQILHWQKITRGFKKEAEQDDAPEPWIRHSDGHYIESAKKRNQLAGKG